MKTNNIMNIHCIIQVEFPGSRLPGKIMLSVCGKPLLLHLVERIKREEINKVIIATSKKTEDDLIFDLCKKIRLIFIGVVLIIFLVDIFNVLKNLEQIL